MKKFAGDMEKDYKKAFRAAYPYIGCSDEVLEEAHEFTLGMPSDLTFDLMKDYILSKDLAEEVLL